MFLLLLSEVTPVTGCSVLHHAFAGPELVFGLFLQLLHRNVIPERSSLLLKRAIVIDVV